LFSEAPHRQSAVFVVRSIALPVPVMFILLGPGHDPVNLRLIGWSYQLS